MAPVALDPAFRAELLALAGQAEHNLGLADTHLAIVCHACRDSAGEPAYEVSLASDRTPQLVREMRRGFPARGTGGKSFSINPLGALFLVEVTHRDIAAARLRITPA